jgi:hypothetical protein
MKRFRVWLYRGLVLITLIMMVISFIGPWWTANLDIVRVKDPIRIYAFGMRQNLTTQEIALFLASDETPAYQTQIAFAYLGAVCVLALLSIWIKGWKGQAMLSSLGLIYIAYAVIAIVWVSSSAGAFNMRLQGISQLTEYAGENQIMATAGIKLCWYLALTSGILMLLLGILRPLIVGKSKAIAGMQK